MPNLTVIIASTRPGRAGLPIATWFAERARAHRAFDVRVVDLAAVDPPMYDEPDDPRLRRYRNAHTKRWTAIVDAADAFVFVTPEYNHGYPATLKNAIDYLHDEWSSKPAGFVSYGGASAGTRAAPQLKQVITAVRMLPAQTRYRSRSTRGSSTKRAGFTPTRSWSRRPTTCSTSSSGPRPPSGRCVRPSAAPPEGPPDRRVPATADERQRAKTAPRVEIGPARSQRR
jgi:NAD(P)H-dependent FMN reductase